MKPQIRTQEDKTTPPIRVPYRVERESVASLYARIAIVGAVLAVICAPSAKLAFDGVKKISIHWGALYGAGSGKKITDRLPQQIQPVKLGARVGQP